MRVEARAAPELRASAIVDALRSASASRSDETGAQTHGSMARGHRASSHGNPKQARAAGSGADSSSQHAANGAFASDWKPVGRYSDAVGIQQSLSRGSRTIRLAGSIVPAATAEESSKKKSKKGKAQRARSGSRGRSSRSRSRTRGRSSSRRKSHRSGQDVDPDLEAGLAELGLGPVPARLPGHDEHSGPVEITTGCTLAIGSSAEDCELCLVAAVERGESEAEDVHVVLAAPLSLDHAAEATQLYVVQGNTKDTLRLLREDIVSFVRNEVVGLAIEKAAAVAAKQAAELAAADAFERHSIVRKRQHLVVPIPPRPRLGDDMGWCLAGGPGGVEGTRDTCDAIAGS